jgi:hypothetical protein
VFCDQFRFFFLKKVAKVYLDYLDAFEAILDMVQIRQDDDRVLIDCREDKGNESFIKSFIPFQ